MIIKFVPFQNEQSSQIRILEKLAISLMAFLVPASYLAGLITPILASKSISGSSLQYLSLPMK